MGHERYSPAKSTWSSVSLIAQAMRTFAFVEEPHHTGVRLKPVYRAIANSPAKPPYVLDEHALSSILEVVRARGLRLDSVPRPFWNRDAKFRLGQVYGAMLEYTDHHHARFESRGLFPPELYVAAYINAVRETPGRAPLARQLQLALDITNNDLLGAVQLCYVGCRVMARAADARVYPNIRVDEPVMREWSDCLARFESIDRANSDGPGDTCHFWMQVFSKMLFRGQGLFAAAADLSVEKGQRLAWGIRNRTTGSGEVSRHENAMMLGRAIGITLCDATYLEVYAADARPKPER